MNLLVHYPQHTQRNFPLIRDTTLEGGLPYCFFMQNVIYGLLVIAT